jgi:predicted ATPase
VLTNYRPEYRHEWGQKTYYTQLRLAPLGHEEAEEFLTFLVGSDGSLKAIKRIILGKTEGTPFFMEEVVQTLAEEGVLAGDRGNYRLVQSPSAIHISPTVQGVLAARIDRLAPDEKALVQQLAVIGREFPLSLVRQVVPQSEADLYRLLSSLQHKEFLYERPAFLEVEYIFKHALTQEVAYNSVLQERRKVLHEQTAHAIEALYSATLEDHYGELAHHYSRSGDTRRAIDYLQLAGQQAVQRSANADAVGYLTAALELLTTLPDTPARARQELDLQTALGHVFVAIKGYGTPDVGRTYTRARELCQQLGDTPRLFPVLRGLWAFYVTQPDYHTARELGEQCYALAQREQDQSLLIEACYALGLTLFFLGEPAPSRALFEQGIALYDPQKHRSHILLYGQEPGVFLHVHCAWTLWMLGYPDQALKRVQEAFALTREFSHPFTLGFALSCACWFHQFRRDSQETRERAEAAIELSTDQGFPFWLAMGIIFRGWALTEHADLLGRQAQGEAEIAQIQQGLEGLLAIGQGLARPHFLGLLAGAYGRLGQAEEGLLALAEALAIVQRTEEHYYEAELHRLKGELTLQQASGQEEAEACFLRAIEIARKQQAKSWELRATMSLARLRQQQGKQKEAHQLLSAIYGWFTEGFDTKDLQETQALLDELGEGM